MSTTRLYRFAMRVPATLLLVTGIAYLLLPTHGYSSETISGWNDQAKNHFLYLATYMIAAFLLTLSLLTYIYASKTPSRPIAWFATVSTGLWIIRFMLEFTFPVNVKLFFLETPHIALMALLGVISAFYALASSLAWGSILIRK